MKGETRLSAPTHTSVHQDQVPLCAPEVPRVVEQECGPTRDPPQPASIDMGLHIGNEGSLMYAADDAGDVPHRPNVHMTDLPREYM